MLVFCEELARSGDQKRAHEMSGYKIGLNQVMTKFDKEGRAYFDALLASKGKMVIDAEGMFTANRIVQDLSINPFTKKYFIKEDGMELLFQVPIVWDIQFNSLMTEEGKADTKRAKSMLDVVLIDHKNKLILPVDLKTGGESFYRSFWKYKRYLQASMYTDALIFSEWIGDVNTELIHEYEIKPLRFIYCDTNLKKSPIIYKLSNKDIAAGREGIDYMEPTGNVDDIKFGVFGRIKYKGYRKLVAELDWHIKNNKWDYDYDTYMSGGEVEANIFSVKL
jgi:hypothetical protein